MSAPKAGNKGGSTLTDHDRLDQLLSVKLHAVQLARELEGVGLPGCTEKQRWIAAAIQGEIVDEERKIAAAGNGTGHVDATTPTP